MNNRNKKVPTTSNAFPSHAVTEDVKKSIEYGEAVGKAIESEWFSKTDGANMRYFNQRQRFHKLRLYARGEQPIQKYKNELSVNGDLSYTNLDWKPVPIIPKFVDIVVNGISERPYEITCFSQDPHSMEKRTAYIEGMLSDMRNKQLFSTIQKEVGMNMFQNSPDTLPETEEELSLHMQLDYKESIEIAQEEALNNVFAINKYDLVKRRVNYDITVLGIGAEEHTFNTAEGIKINYRDPSDIVYSYTESPYFDDIYYQGVVDKMSVSELKKNHPHLSQEDIAELEDITSMGQDGRTRSERMPDLEDGYVYVLRYYYKTYHEQVYKLKHTASGGIKAISKNDDFNPSEEEMEERGYERVARSIEVLYEGAKIVGHDITLKWELAKNMTRPKSDITRVSFPINIVAPRIYRGMPESLVSRMISFADSIQIIHLKLQQVLARLTPDGVFLDADGLSEIDLGNGTSYDPQEALNMFLQTGSVIGRSMTTEGDPNSARIPIQEINTSGGNAKISSLIQSYNMNLQMIRDVTGLNEARDGSTPDKEALVGVQKLAAANSNTATRHILDGGIYLTLKTAEGVTLRISDVLEYANTRESFINSLGRFNVATLTEIRDLHNHDFGIYINIAPDEEEKQILENNIQMALSKEHIDLEDAIDIRETKNTKLANQLLKIRRRKKQERDRAMQLENIQAQAESNAQAAERKAAAEMQREQAIAETKAQLSKLEHQLAIDKLDMEAQKKKELMYFEFQLNQKLKELEIGVISKQEEYKEDRKDKRTKIQASQQSELIQQRQAGTPPKDFESSGNDVLGGFDLGQFEPK